jgi:threonine dehydratase
VSQEERAAPAEITASSVKTIRGRLGEYVLETPVHHWRSSALSELLSTGTDVFLKLEFLQYTGTFKVRGAFNVLLSQGPNALQHGVTAISAGNHAIATAYAAQRLGLSAKVVMLKHANPFRVELCRSLGAELILAEDAQEGFMQVERLVRDESRFFVHPFDGIHTSLGTATLGYEFCHQVDALDAVIVPIGGGGLASGVAAAVKAFAPECAVYGVEPEGAPTMTRALEAGKPVTLEAKDLNTIADSLAAPFAGTTSLELCKAHLDDVVLLTDDEILKAQALAFRDLKFALEPAGAAATAGLLGPLRERLSGLRVGIVACGTNIDEQTFHEQLSRLS